MYEDDVKRQKEAEKRKWLAELEEQRKQKQLESSRAQLQSEKNLTEIVGSNPKLASILKVISRLE